MRRTPLGCECAALLRIASLLLLSSPLALGYIARLVLEDGRPFPAAPLILPPMTGRSCAVRSIDRNGRIVYSGPPVDFVPTNTGIDHSQEERVTDTCDAAFMIQGYGKVAVTLHDGAVIVVKRSGEKAEGLEVSRTTLQVPTEAKKAWQKGIADLDHKKWAQAEKELRRAVSIYPEYATAWSALGEALDELSRPADARAAWERANQADPNYVKPYVQLAQLAIRERRMEDAIGITSRAMQSGYTQTLPVYFYHAVAHLALGRLDAAEKSARKALELDPAHEFPKTENLLGTILAAKGDRQGAVEHMKKYLELAPKAEDSQKVKQRIAELER